MDRLGLEEGEVIQHSMITKSIERAQKKVEENNFAIRKRLLEYDDIMNSQREVIYKRRKNALYGERLQLDIMNNFYDTAESIVENTVGDYDGFKLACLHSFGIDFSIEHEEFGKIDAAMLANQLYQQAYEKYLDKNKQIMEKTYPVISKVFDEKGATVEEIVVPFADGKKMVNVIVNLKKAKENNSAEVVKNMEQSISLAIIDQGWKEHLREMDELKEQVQNARYEQKDPLVIYKFEAFELFKGFIGTIANDIVDFLSKANIAVNDPNEVQNARNIRQQRASQRVRESKAESGSVLGGGNSAQPQAPRREVEITKPRQVTKTIGRNDKVTVKYPDGTTKKDVKYKSVEKDVIANKCVIVES
jgi:preprotein translocase subunit SecA